MNENGQEFGNLPEVLIIKKRDGSVRVKTKSNPWPALCKGAFTLSLHLALLLCFFVPFFLGVKSMSMPLVSEQARQKKHVNVAPYDYQLKVAVPSTLSSSALSPYGPGFEQELLENFCTQHGFIFELVPAVSREEALSMLQAGKVNLVIGFGGKAPAEHEEFVVEGPPYAQFKPILVYKPLRKDGEEAQAEVETPFSVAAELTPRILNNGDGKVLLDPASYSLRLPLDSSLRTGRILSQTVAYHWFWGRNDILLDSALEEFWSAVNTADQLDELTERYYGFFPKKPQPEDLKALAEAIDGSLIKYASALQKASEASGLDPLLIAAVVFQESRFNPEATSSTGVRGMMQLTQNTADMLKVDRLDPAQSIIGGARYLRILWDELEEFGLEPWDRWCMALAAFNQGPGNLKKVLRHADDAPTWAELKKLYPEISRKGLAGSGFRGREAVDFVESVRYYYYVLSGLSGIARSEGQNFSGLVAFTTPAGS